MCTIMSCLFYTVRWTMYTTVNTVHNSEQWTLYTTVNSEHFTYSIKGLVQHGELLAVNMVTEGCLEKQGCKLYPMHCEQFTLSCEVCKLNCELCYVNCDLQTLNSAPSTEMSTSIPQFTSTPCEPFRPSVFSSVYSVDCTRHIVHISMTGRQSYITKLGIQMTYNLSPVRPCMALPFLL